jgi:hypothetical protein
MFSGSGSSLRPTSRRRSGSFSSHSAPMHFKENEAPLLALYCMSIHLARFYAGNIGSEG